MKTKKLKILALAAFFSLGFISLNATVLPKESKSAGPVTEKIRHTLSLPQELKNPGSTQKVKVSFVIAENGTVESVAANTKNIALKQNVENQFRQLTFPELKAGLYNVQVIFNVY
jgi:hypothetical protein